MNRPAKAAVSSRLVDQSMLRCSTEPARSMAGARPAREWKAATLRATATRWASSKSGSATIVANLRSAGSRRITTMWSTGAPASSTMSWTPRYTSGANRRFSCTSRRQSARRSSRVEKSRNGVVTGLRTLYTRSPMKNSTEMWVSTTAARSTKPMPRHRTGSHQRPTSQSRDAPREGLRRVGRRAPGARIHRHPARRTHTVTPDRQTGANCS